MELASITRSRRPFQAPLICGRVSSTSLLAMTEPLVKRWTGHLRYRACLSPGATSKQRIAACVDKGKPQEVACALYPPGAEKSLELACRFFDRHQLADPSQSRGPGTKAERIAHAWRDRRLWLILS